MKEGDVFTLRYPYIRCTYEDTLGWKPGTKPYYAGDLYEEADGEGFVEYTLISLHKPADKYPMRVFYTRRWIDPDGLSFGKTRLYVAVLSKFKRLLQGFRYEYTIADGD